MAELRWPRYVLPAALAVGAFVVFRSGKRPAAPPAAEAPKLSAEPAVERLTGLKLHDTLGPWKLTHVRFDPASNGVGQLRMEFERKGSFCALWISARGKVPLMPVETGSYALAFGGVRQEGEPIGPAEPKALAEQVAERVKAREAAAPTVEGL